MSIGRFIVLSGAFLAVFLAVEASKPAPRGYWAPEAYVQQADSLIQGGMLWLECATLDDVAQDSIRWNFEPESAEETFFTSSYLRSDVRTFNRDPRLRPSPFRIEGCKLLGVNPYYHRIDLPLSPQVRWMGDVLYNTYGRVTSLHGAEGHVVDVRHRSSPLEQWKDAAVRLDAPEDTSAHGVHFTHPSVEGYLADVTYLGRDPVLTDRHRTAADPPVRVAGFEVFRGRPVRLEEGDWVRFDLPGAPRTFLVDRETRRGTASLVRHQGRSVERLYLSARDEPFVRPFASAVNTSLRAAWDQGRRSAVLEGFSVRLSLDQTLIDALDAPVQEACRQDFPVVPERPRATSLIVMDGMTGEVRAMPSCPNEAWLNEQYPQLSDQLRARYLENQNLAPHPIGSAGKPFWAASVGSTFPNLLDLRIEPFAGAEVDRVLGCALPEPYDNSFQSTNPVGLEAFIQHSCNRYQVEMATAALAIDPAAATAGGCTNPLQDPADLQRCFPLPEAPEEASTFQVCDQVIRAVLSPDLRAVGSQCEELQELERAFLPRSSFEAVTNVQTVKEPRLRTELERSGDPLVNRYRTARYRTDAWRDVFGFLDRQGVDVATSRVRFPFTSASPEATNLQLNTIRDLRSSWVSALLGGENSRWSNFQLAESLARLMTGRRIEGRFVSGILSESEYDGGVAEAGDFLPSDALRDGVRRRVLHAMELVVEGGTAGSLADEVADLRARIGRLFPGEEGYDLYVFAKTGTPFVEKLTTRREAQVLERLIAVGDIRWDADTRRFQVADPEDSRLLGSLSPDFQAYIRQDLLRAVEDDPDAYVQDPGEARPRHPFYFSPEGDLRLNPDRVRRRGAVLILGFLAVPESSGRTTSAEREDWISACALNPNLRRDVLDVPPRELIDPTSAVALTTALYIDDLRDEPGVTSSLAVRLMEDLFPTIGDYLVREISTRQRRSLPLRNVGR